MSLSEINKIISLALKEDAAHQDITTNLLIPKDQITDAYIIIKEDAIICGLDIVKATLKKLDRAVKFQNSFKDGNKVKKNTKILFITGKTRALLAAERVALNFLSHLSGVSTNTHRFVQKVRPLKTAILDTRKTTPGLRELEKYAVRCGGGSNHRTNLAEMILIKDNHKKAYQDLATSAQVIKGLRKKTNKPIEIEVESLFEFKNVLAAKPDFILLDNMSPAQIKQAVALNKKLKTKILLEASGGINLNNIKSFAKTGVDRISIGALTHSSKAINVSMEFI